ncbi:uncharacterized protein J4E84_007604 [Alternaria hordeiaustralica]|uniref:uncharacterized protein n=1 Tax=Alternaria hordeiaustralica TaxID=1187925 RepID=UPI0020C5A2B6|nr:uncharacterized protein J4E84_007604 [Alternaria hordeiaustralica]KAI4681368.1 hypothetical protein J4E84_007604 [Alternaria hordeiaustralica]
MPPKKKVAAAEGGEAEGGAFRWTLENANKVNQLLILTQGRYLTGEDYERLVSVFPGTNLNGVKIKVSRFRVEQRKLFDEYGWTLPDGGAVLKKTPTPRKNKKRDAEEEAGDGDDVEEETPKAKKPRGRKAKAKKEACVEAEVEEEDSGKVKEEILDEDM